MNEARIRDPFLDVYRLLRIVREVKLFLVSSRVKKILLVRGRRIHAGFIFATRINMLCSTNRKPDKPIVKKSD
jgi:hypothetical protein